MTAELRVLLGDEPVGTLRTKRHGKVEFEYGPEWQVKRGAYPLSFSMPLAARQHSPKVVEPYLWGLLPDNDRIVERWAQRFQVSARNAFALLSHVGGDCPGAVRLLRPDAVGRERKQGDVEWLGEADVAARLRALRTDFSAWRVPADTGQFSLAGAQPKTAFYFDGKRWGVPSGSIPTTHILKPGVIDLEGSAENEHFCLAIAREIGLAVAASRIRRFEDQIAIVIERYDRIVEGRKVHRVHQEDICQALSVHPASKYENEGGPGARAVVRLLRAVSGDPERDIDTFVTALVFSWLIGGTDAHAKNYSLLIGAEGRARLAPLYDVASALPYADMSWHKLKLAMKIGGKYRLREIGAYQWQKFARDVSLDPEYVLSTALNVTRLCPAAVDRAFAQIRAERLKHPVFEKLCTALRERAARCLSTLGG